MELIAEFNIKSSKMKHSAVLILFVLAAAVILVLAGDHDEEVPVAAYSTMNINETGKYCKSPEDY